MIFSKKKNTYINRHQKRLFEKQKRVFVSTFSNFNTYQLEEIEKIIRNLRKEKEHNK